MRTPHPPFGHLLPQGENAIAESSVPLGVQHLHRLGVQFRGGGGEAVAAGFGGAAVPGGDDAAGVFDQRDQGGDVDVLECGFDHEVDVAGGEQCVAVAIETVAGGEAGFADAVPGEDGAAALEDFGRGGGEFGASETGDR